MPSFQAKAIDLSFRATLRAEIDAKTKPLGALGEIEDLALQLGLIQGSLKPEIKKPTLMVFAGDHGIAQEAVSPYPQSVTSAMVKNFAEGGAAINVFTRQLGWDLELIDAGTLEPCASPLVTDVRIGAGTKSFLRGKAMSESEMQTAMDHGAALVRKQERAGTNVLGFGEMGIGNSSAAAMLIHSLAAIPLEKAVSRGAGCNDLQLQQKLRILQEARAVHGSLTDPRQVLQTYGGFEIAMMTGAYLEGARLGMSLVVDGLISSSAALAALRLCPESQAYMIFAHCSAAVGHRELLEALGVKALLNLQMRLGEGTGAALALPLLQCASAMLREMATFSSAQIAGPSEA